MFNIFIIFRTYVSSKGPLSFCHWAEYTTHACTYGLSIEKTWRRPCSTADSRPLLKTAVAEAPLPPPQRWDYVCGKATLRGVSGAAPWPHRGSANGCCDAFLLWHSLMLLIVLANMLTQQWRLAPALITDRAKDSPKTLYPIVGS